MRSPLRVISSVALVLALAGCSGGKDKNESTQAPRVDTATPATGIVGTSVTIAGEDFGGDQGTSSVTIGGATANVTSWSGDEIVVTVPAAAFPGSRDIVVTTGDGASNPIQFSVTLPRAIYVNDDILVSDNSVEGFALSASNVPSAIAGSPWLQGVTGPAYGGDGATLLLDAPRRRVFTTADERLYAWSIDGATGVLTTTGSLALTGADFLYGLAIEPDGSTVYVCDFAAGAIHGASVSSNGTLATLAGSPFDAGLDGTSKIQLSMDGSFLYANNEDAVNSEIRGFLVGANGTLAEMPNSPFNNPGSSYTFQRSPIADRYYVALPAYIAAYDPNGAGDLTENVGLRESVTNVIQLDFTADGTRLFGITTTQLYVFDVAGTGELISATGSPFTLTGVTAAGAVHVSEDGSQLFLKETDAAEFHLYTISAAGAPTEVSGSPFPLRATAAASGAAFTF